MEPGEFDALYDASYARLVDHIHAMIGDRDGAGERPGGLRARLGQRRTFAEGAEPRGLAADDGVPAGGQPLAHGTADGVRRPRPIPAGPRHGAPTRTTSPCIAALDRLPADQRRALVLHHLCDLRVAEVADEVGAPVGTVKARLSRGRTALQHLLTADDLTRGPPCLTSSTPLHDLRENPPALRLRLRGPSPWRPAPPSAYGGRAAPAAAARGRLAVGGVAEPAARRAAARPGHPRPSPTPTRRPPPPTDRSADAPRPAQSRGSPTASRSPTWTEVDGEEVGLQGPSPHLRPSSAPRVRRGRRPAPTGGVEQLRGAAHGIVYGGASSWCLPRRRGRPERARPGRSPALDQCADTGAPRRGGAGQRRRGDATSATRPCASRTANQVDGAPRLDTTSTRRPRRQRRAARRGRRGRPQRRRDRLRGAHTRRRRSAASSRRCASTATAAAEATRSDVARPLGKLALPTALQRCGECQCRRRTWETGTGTVSGSGGSPASAARSPTGVLPTLTPTASRASFLAAAVPEEPETMAPAWPIVLPSGAVKPAT